MNRSVILTIIALNVLVFGGIAAIAFFGSGGFGGSDLQAEPAQKSMMTGDFVLALSWEPAFCETRPRVPECRSQTADSLDAQQFSLHGLWPEDVYCGVDADTRRDDEKHNWDDLPSVTLSTALRQRLDAAMPGTQSELDRHEWIKHGTCAGGDMEAYYAASLALVDAVNASALPELFDGNLGNSLSAARIADVFDEAFGTGTGDRISLECVTDGSRRLISGIRIALSGTIGAEPDLGALAANAAARSGDCRSGVIDPAGLQ